MADEQQIAEYLKQVAEDDKKERLRVFERMRDEIMKANLSASENYDRALLTLSSAFFGGSLAFIETIVGASVRDTHWPLLLYASWGLFAFTIGLTLASFLYMLWKAPKLIDAAWTVYFSEDEKSRKSADEVPRKVQRCVLVLNTLYGVCFAAAVCALGVYVYRNLTEPPMKPSDSKIGKKAMPPAAFQKPVPPAATGPKPQQQEQPKEPVAHQQQSQKKGGS